MWRKIFYLGIIITGMLAIANCGNTEEESVEVPDFDDSTIYVTGVEIEEIIQSLPSPAEMAASIEASGVPFSKSYLASPEEADDYDTNFKKALGLGVLSADLGYLNVYQQSNEIVNFLSAIRSLSDDLNVGQFFDFQTLKRLSNSNNIDSLMFLSQSSFRQMDNYLRKNYRSHLSALVVTGVWIEGLYLITQIVKDGSTNDVLKETIGDQKTSLEMINKVIQVYKGRSNEYKNLAIDFEKLKDAYNEVEVEIIHVEPRKITFEDGSIAYVPGDSAVITMPEENLEEIISLAETVRNKLITLEDK